MKIKLDENIPVSAAPALQSLGHDTDTVIDEGLAGRDDPTVWQAAQTEGRLLITQDLDFSDIRRFQPGTHHGILLLRLASPGRMALHERILYLARLADFANWSRCFVVATEHKVRVIPPP